MSIYYPLWYVAGAGSAASSLLTNLISYWKMDEASGTRADSVVASANNLTATNNPLNAAGIISNAAALVAASSQYLSHADNASLRIGVGVDFTIGLWARLDTTGAFRALVMKDDNGEREYGLLIGSTELPTFYATVDGATVVQVVSSITLVVNTWYAIMAWHDHATAKLNISVNDGAADQTAMAGGVFSGTREFRIGARDDNVIYMNGRIDEVGFWKTILTPTQRTNWYNAGAGVTHPFTGVP